LHLTIHFLGETPAEKLEDIITALQKIAADTAAFTLHLDCLEPGPKPKSPRLIWARFAAHPAFMELCTAVTRQLGVKPSSQDYIPHITLARFRKDVAKPTGLPTIDLKTQQISLPVNSLALWQSELKSPHPVYRILVMYPLMPPISKPN
jgi:2'-5' RNA ligase